MTNAAAVLEDTEALKQAFLRGAGIAPDAIGQLTPELMDMLGALMASALQGTIDLLALRSLVKHEVKADVTVIVTRNNNPLKFFPDSQTVLTQMLRKKMPGFMEPLEALDDARRDLRGHQMGVVAGTRATMDRLIARFDPVSLNAALPAVSLLDKLIPGHRTTTLWKAHRREHRHVMREAQDQFNTLFGKTFLDAYEQEVTRASASGSDV